jgi:hypothetical protein
LFCSIGVGGVGLTLIQFSMVFFFCKKKVLTSLKVILLEPNWIPMKQTQAEDRIWRIGQKEKCLIVKLILENSVEDKLVVSLQFVFNF